MKPISPVLPSNPQLPEVTYAKDQPQYLQLPAVNIDYADGSASCITRWKLSWRERIKILITGCFWWEQMHFNEPLQPQHPWINEPLKDMKTVSIPMEGINDLC